MVEAIPGVFEADPEVAAEKARALKRLASIVHIDVADGKFVGATAFEHPNALAETELPTFEAHLMVTEPARYLDAAQAAGATRVIGHVEADGIADFFDQATAGSASAGLAIDLPTDLTALDPYLEQADFVLVMAVKAGRSGQAFSERAVEKVAGLRNVHPDLILEVDGGVSDRTAAALISAGADRLVATSYIERASDPQAAIERIRNPSQANG